MTSATTPPIASIGLPVFNGARFLLQALDSLLAQTMRDFELIISDNASTDETAEICNDYARRDARIRYLRQETNIGAPRNWSFVVTQARGRYFKWASANDLCAPQMLERCLAALEEHPHAVLCYGRTALIDESSGERTDYSGDFSLVDERPSDRFTHLLQAIGLNNPQCGVIRLEILRRTGLDRPYPGGDLPLMAELALRGRYLLLDEVFLFRRMGQATFSSRLTGHERNRFFGSESNRISTAIRLYLDYSSGILRAPIDLQEKGRSMRYLARHAAWDLLALLRKAS